MTLDSMINVERRFDNQQLENELSIVNFKAIGWLEVQNSSGIACILVSRLESTRGPRRMVIVRRITMPRISRGGAILTTFSTQKTVILQDRT